MISPARHEDAQDIADLWNHYVETSTATFRSEHYSVEEIVTLLEELRRKDRAFFVARNEKLLGFSLYKQFRTGNGYRHTMEHTIYLHQSAQGRGIGRKLFEALEQHARYRDVHSFIGGVTAENSESIAFHKKLGFREIGHIPQVAKKFGQWHEIAFVQKILEN